MRARADVMGTYKAASVTWEGIVVSLRGCVLAMIIWAMVSFIFVSYIRKHSRVGSYLEVSLNVIMSKEWIVPFEVPHHCRGFA